MVRLAFLYPLLEAVISKAIFFLAPDHLKKTLTIVKFSIGGNPKKTDLYRLKKL